MKKQLLLFLVLLFITNYSRSQTPILWGMTPTGGDSYVGNIFNTNATGTTFKNDFSFNVQTTYFPMSNLIEAGNGLLYGMTLSGGANGYGTIFSYNITTGKETELYDFGYGKDGRAPDGSLIQASDSLLYGTTSEGGAYNYGTIFSYNIITGIETDLHDFGKGADGQSPNSSEALIQINDSLLCGTTYEGGVYSYGTIFTYNILNTIETDVHDFGSDSDGTYPVGSLITDSNGFLYGMTGNGGSNDTIFGGDGTIFSYNISTGTETAIYSFGESTGGFFPTGSLVKADNKLFYGMTQAGGNSGQGVIFNYNTSTNILQNIYNFQNGGDGLQPLGSLIQANDSLLYGLTYLGGVNNQGTIFSYNISTNTETVIHDFGNGTDGQLPENSLFQASDGLLYGMTFVGGVNNKGTIFSYNISSATESDRFDFSTRIIGTQPHGSLIQANNGLLYGMTLYGGYNGYGTIFSYNILTDSEIDVHNFGLGVDGEEPYGSLIQANNGLLYGMTSQGGDNQNGFSSFGTIFSFNISTGMENVVHNFTSDTDGNDPDGSLIQASNGLLYGMTEYGGLYGEGTLFSYDISTGKETDLLNFGYPTLGYYPFGSLVQANNGLLYGMTDIGGGPNYGGIMFSYDISTGVETDVHDFGHGLDGGGITGSLIQASDGLLYGMSERGGTEDSGTIFSYNISSGLETVLYNFIKDSDGWYPFGSLIQASDRLLYGMTWEGGAYDHGTVFSYNISTGTETVIHSFNGIDGDSPRADLLEADSSTTTSISKSSVNNNQLSVYPNPAGDYFNINLSLQQPQSVQLTLYNILGQQVWYNNLGSIKQTQVTLPVTNLAEGVYVLRVNEGNTWQQREIVVTR